jgi:hypothetical protein
LQRVHLFVEHLGFSLRLFVRAYPNKRLAWLLDGEEQAFRNFGWITGDICTIIRAPLCCATIVMGAIGLQRPR